MVHKVCHGGCECHKCKTKKTKTKTKAKKNTKQMKPNQNVIMDMRGMTIQPNNTILPSQFNTPKDILDIKNSLIELLQKEKKKLTGVISTQTEDMHEIVDDIATEKAINSIGMRNNINTEYKPKLPKREETFNIDFTALDSPFDVGMYKAKSPKFEEKSNNDFETSSDKFFATAQTSFKKTGLINDIDEPIIDPINGRWIHNQTQLFDAEVPDRIIAPLEKHASQKPNMFLSETNPITTGNAHYEQTFRPAPVTVYQEPIKYKSNKPNIFIYEDDEDYGRPTEDFNQAKTIRKYQKSDEKVVKETRVIDVPPASVETQRGMRLHGDFTHTNTQLDDYWISSEKIIIKYI